MTATRFAPDWRPTRHDRADLGRQATALLRGLGADTGDVAGALAGAGVTGEPTDVRQCALAVYLRAVMEGDRRVASVRVFHDRLVVGSPGRLRTRRVSVALPPPVRAFVAGFDARRYPALVRLASPTAGSTRRQAVDRPQPSPAGDALR